MADVAVLLTGKLDTLGWGNILAREVWRIYQAYEALGEGPPTGLLEQLNVEYVIELLVNVSRALCEEGKICRISGSWGMGHVLGLVQVLFPRSTIVTVEDTVLQSVENAVIRLEFHTQNSDEPTLIHLETLISGLCWTIKLPNFVRFPLASEQNLVIGYHDLYYRFRWDGWIADFMAIRLLDAGLKDDQTLLDACCEYLILVPSIMRMDTSKDLKTSRSRQELRSIPLIGLLGPLARARMSKICEIVWRSRPRGDSGSLPLAFTKLIDVVGGILRKKRCKCYPKCDWRTGWALVETESREPTFHTSNYDRCPIRLLWKIIGYALGCGLWTFFIDAGPNTVVCPPDHLVAWPITSARGGGDDVHIAVTDVMKGVMSYVDLQIPSAERTGDDSYGRHKAIARSSNSCTIYPKVVETLSVPSTQSFTFVIVEGQIIHEGRYHQRLFGQGKIRGLCTPEVGSLEIRPSNVGCATGSPLLTILEAYGELRMRCLLQYDGNQYDIELGSVIMGFAGMRWARDCDHNTNTPLEAIGYKVVSTSIAAPIAADAVSVVMTRGNPTSQFFSCETGGLIVQYVLQRNCCLNCAAKQVYDKDWGVIICG